LSYAAAFRDGHRTVFGFLLQRDPVAEQNVVAPASGVSVATREASGMKGD
jgi:hypothetical protein